jgi:two-component system response regulator QseB
MRVLIVEDDPLLGDGLAAGLKLSGYAVDWFRTANQARQAVLSVDYDAIVLDLGLPDQDGADLLSQWRGKGLQTPIVVLTARDAVENRIQGLDAGADEYLIKPITLEELAARLRAVVRRSAGKPEPRWQHGALEYEPAGKKAYWNNSPLELTRREANLLELFLTHPNRVLTRDFIHQKLYDWDDDPESNAVEVHVHHLRRKIHPRIVRTLRGTGYTLGASGDLQ